MRVIQSLSHPWCHGGGCLGVKYSLEAEQDQPLNEYDLWYLPTIPWALIFPLHKKTKQNKTKKLKCLMIPKTLGWVPALINEPHLWGASIPRWQTCLAAKAHPGDEFPSTIFFFPSQFGASGWTGETESLHKLSPSLSLFVCRFHTLFIASIMTFTVMWQIEETNGKPWSKSWKLYIIKRKSQLSLQGSIFLRKRKTSWWSPT